MEIKYFLLLASLFLCTHSLPFGEDGGQSSASQLTTTQVTTAIGIKESPNDEPIKKPFKSVHALEDRKAYKSKDLNRKESPIQDAAGMKDDTVELDKTNEVSQNPVLELVRKKRAPKRTVEESISLVYEACIVFFVLFGVWMCILCTFCIVGCAMGPKAKEKLRSGSGE